MTLMNDASFTFTINFIHACDQTLTVTASSEPIADVEYAIGSGEFTTDAFEPFSVVVSTEECKLDYRFTASP